ncbi:hypothetical protein PTKIN_Ptkin12aG0182100 [Pterospermum kingtungense]
MIPKDTMKKTLCKEAVTVNIVGKYKVPTTPSYRFAITRMVHQKVDSGGPYRLLQCASKGDKAGVMQELEKGVEPNLADYDRRTALHLAACEGWTEVVALLLEKGADVDAVDRWGRTPLSHARSFHHDEICKIFEARGGIDPVGVDSQAPCFQIDCFEVNMNVATFIGERIHSSIASNPKAKNTFMKELALWQKLRHPNIVQFLGVLKNCDDYLIFLTEYLQNGSLYDTLKKKGRLDRQTAIAYALDIARGMNYLHQHKPHAIVHRDLTPRNVLQDEAGRLKSIDLIRYLAPEVYRQGSYGKSIDVFSFALIVHEWFWLVLSEFSLLRECWHKDPDCRPTFQEIILQLEMIQQDFQREKATKACRCCYLL